MTRQTSAGATTTHRVLVHDFPGHPLAAHLSRSLARRGHHVDHVYCSGVESARGALERRDDDPASLRFADISDRPFERYSPVGRLRSEISYGRLLARHCRQLDPDVVLSANAPLLSQAALWIAARRCGAARVYWVQDLLGRGTRAVLTQRSRVLGETLGRGLEQLETTLLRRSHATAVITEDFVTELRRRRVDRPTTVIENWAPLDDIDQRPKDTPWSRERGYDRRPVVLYAGTLGLKHDPHHLVHLAEALRGRDAVLLVLTEGTGRTHLEEQRVERGLQDVLHLRDYAGPDELPDVLGAADICLVLLEPDAGVFSVPSKVLAYLAGGRPVVGAMPGENLASRTIVQSGAGRVGEPGDYATFTDNVLALLDDDDARRRCGAAARAHAEAHFDIDVITDLMEGVVNDALDEAQP